MTEEPPPRVRVTGPPRQVAARTRNRLGDVHEQTPLGGVYLSSLLRAQLKPTPTANLDLLGVALEIGITVNHSTYDTLYLAFAVAMGASGVVIADGPFVRAMRTHPDPALAALVLPLDVWARSRGHAA